MNEAIKAYNHTQTPSDQAICDSLADQINQALPQAESKIWHGSPVWFLDGNPVVGYAVRKQDVQLLFWSGQSFDEPGLKISGSFKAAQALYADVTQINSADLKR